MRVENNALTVNLFGPQGSFDVSSEGGCLQCGDDCLPAVQESLPSCLAPALAAAGAFIGVPVPDLGITGSTLSCLKELFGSASSCRRCVESLVVRHGMIPSNDF